MKKVVIMGLFISSFCVLSCNELKDNNPEPNSYIGDGEILIPSTAKLIDNSFAKLSYLQNQENYEEFAKLLAISLKDKDLRKFLKEEANKKFDGDYDILVSKISNHLISGEKFESKVKKSDTKKSNYYDNAIKNEKLNISIPIHIDKWNDSKSEILVVVSNGVDENKTLKLKAFDSNGKTYLIDAKVDPDQPVIVIGENERMNINSNSILPLKNARPAFIRVAGKAETISYIKCPNIAAIEPWYWGGPELRFHYTVYSVSNGTAFSPNPLWSLPSRSTASGGYYPALNMFNWYFNNSHGQNYIVSPFEIDDSGITQTLAVTVSGKIEQVGVSATYTISYKEGDEILAGRLINYQDDSPSMVSDSKIRYDISNL